MVNFRNKLKYGRGEQQIEQEFLPLMAICIYFNLSGTLYNLTLNFRSFSTISLNILLFSFERIFIHTSSSQMC